MFCPASKESGEGGRGHCIDRTWGYPEAPRGRPQAPYLTKPCTLRLPEKVALSLSFEDSCYHLAYCGSREFSSQMDLSIQRFRPAHLGSLYGCSSYLGYCLFCRKLWETGFLYFCWAIKLTMRKSGKFPGALENSLPR